MGVLPRPDVPPGPHRELVDALHGLHHRAGWPSLRRLALQTGVSHTTVSKALSSATLPTWGTIELLVEAMDGDLHRFRELWLAASSPAAAGPGERPAVRIAGRVAELAVVRRHLESGSGLLLVTGEAGIGKSTLVDAAVASTDVFVAVGHCLDLSREMPLMPVVDALRTVLEHGRGRWMDDALATCPAYVRASLSRLLPELEDRPGVPATDDPWGLERLFASVVTVLRALAATRPVAVHLEDCHWADRGTLDLVTHVASSPSVPPLVVTWRSDDPDVSVVHLDWLSRTRWSPGVDAVDLAPFSLAETTQQLELLDREQADAELAGRIHARSRGLPLYTAQLATSPFAAELPRHLADLLDRRIGDLDDESWRVARVLGVAQRRVPPGVLRAATGLAPESVDGALHLLARRGLLRTGTGDDAELAHPLFVEAVSRRLVPGEAAEVHARLAEAMSQVVGIEPAEIADHWRAAGRHDHEASSRVDAAIAAGARFAYREELDTWLRVLALWDEGHTPEDVDLWEVLVRAIDAATEAGDVDAGHDLAERAARMDLDELPDRSRAQVLHRLGCQRYEEGDGAGAEALMDQALRLLEPLPPSPELLRLVEDRFGILMQGGRRKEALAALERSSELVGIADARFVRRHRSALVWGILETTGDVDAAVAEALRGLDSDDDPDPVGDLMIAANATDVLLHSVAPASRAEQVARVPLAQADTWDLRHSYPGVLVRTNVCWAHLLEGDTSAARSWIEPVTQSPPTPNTAFAHLMLAAVELREGDTPAAVERSRAADSQIRVHDQNWTQSLPWTAEIGLWAGHAGHVRTLLRGVLERDLSGEPADTTGPMLVMLARAHGDALEGVGASRDTRRSTSQALQELVADARADPFGPGAQDVATPARARLWEAELSRVEGRATVPGWVRAAAEWDSVRRPHDAAYCRWRGAQVALLAGEGVVASRLAKRAAADARQHAPLRDAAAATGRAG